MIPSWQSYNDPLNSVSKPLQMGPVWMHASQVTGVKMNYAIWHQDPPASSYPSCIAVKCAGLQSSASEELFLHTLREAVMVKGLNISKKQILFNIAEELGTAYPKVFNANTFFSDWDTEEPNRAFRRDLQLSSYYKVGRYPTLTLKRRDQKKGVMVVGYRPYDVLNEAFKLVAP
jgi:predicted DsbA family dithiol-disulfide isomerase